MKLDKGAVRALADRIRRSIHEDLSDRSGCGFGECDRETRDEITQTHTNLIAKEIEEFFA